jgi:hypothetical protein
MKQALAQTLAVQIRLQGTRMRSVLLRIYSYGITTNSQSDLTMQTQLL